MPRVWFRLQASTMAAFNKALEDNEALKRTLQENEERLKGMTQLQKDKEAVDEKVRSVQYHMAHCAFVSWRPFRVHLLSLFAGLCMVGSSASFSLSSLGVVLFLTRCGVSEFPRFLFSFPIASISAAFSQSCPILLLLQSLCPLSLSQSSCIIPCVPPLFRCRFLSALARVLTRALLSLSLSLTKQIRILTAQKKILVKEVKKYRAMKQGATGSSCSIAGSTDLSDCLHDSSLSLSPPESAASSPTSASGTPLARKPHSKFDSASSAPTLHSGSYSPTSPTPFSSSSSCTSASTTSPSSSSSTSLQMPHGLRVSSSSSHDCRTESNS